MNRSVCRNPAARILPVLLLGSLVLGGCAAGRGPGREPAAPTTGIIGLASWYGRKFHGRTTASGERFDMHELTAAHRTLPFGTRVRVTNLANGRRVTVRVNDRGPFRGDRIIDLSYGAAKRIGMIREGITRVRLEILDPPG